MKNIWIVAGRVMPAVPAGLLAPALFNIKISSVLKLSDLLVVPVFKGCLQMFV